MFYITDKGTVGPQCGIKDHDRKPWFKWVIQPLWRFPWYHIDQWLLNFLIIMNQVAHRVPWPLASPQWLNDPCARSREKPFCAWQKGIGSPCPSPANTGRSKTWSPSWPTIQGSLCWWNPRLIAFFKRSILIIQYWFLLVMVLVMNCVACDS